MKHSGRAVKSLCILVLAAMSAILNAGDDETEDAVSELLSQSKKPYLHLHKNVQVPIPDYFTKYQVRSTNKLLMALQQANRQGGNAAIIIADGEYRVEGVLRIKAPNIFLLSASGDPEKTILTGKGMIETPDVDNLIRVEASGFVLDGLSLKNVGNHLIQITAENNVDTPTIRNCILQDAYEQLFKVSYNKNTPEIFSDHGLVEYCRFEYTAGIGPNYYIGGIDAHGVRNWVIRKNFFRDIASPREKIAEHAIHIWSNSSDNLVEENVIIDSDRGIGFGMRQKHPQIRYGNKGGVIVNNLIYHSGNNDLFPDAGITLEDSSQSKVFENWILLNNDYENAIEIRFATTTGVLVKNNKINKAIKLRDSSEAIINDNYFISTKGTF